jgi:2-methylcitrate dehydratase PrpD
LIKQGSPEIDMESANDKPIEKLVKNILETRFEDIERPVIEQAKLRIIDTIGCLIGGAADPGNPELVELLTNQGGRREATILIYGGKVPVGHAAMANSILCRSFDYEPVSPIIDNRIVPAHISATSVMTALSLAEMLGTTGRELITAMLVGEDMTARVLAASGFNIDLGWDGNGTANAFAATAIAGRLLDLNYNQLRHAFGLALSQMAGTMQNIWDGSPAFKLPQGLSARNGIFSAQLAAIGWTGPDDALMGPNGYYHLYTNGILKPDILTKELGRRYYADRAIKPYPACRATHAPIACALSMVDRYEIKAEDIQKVSLFMPRWNLDNFCGKPLNFGLFPHADAAFSYQYTVAVALMYGSVRPRHFQAEVITDPATLDFVKRVRLLPWPDEEKQDIGIKIELRDGREFFEISRDAKGDFIDNPMSNEEFYDKFWDNVEYSQKIPKANTEILLSRLQNLEKKNNIVDLIGYLVADRG